MPVNTQPCLDAILGDWKDRGFSLKETADPIDETDSLVVIYFNGEKIGTYYRSKLTINNVPVIQRHCENYWNNRLRQLTEDLNDG